MRSALMVGALVLATGVVVAAQASARSGASGGGTFAVTSSKSTTRKVGPVTLYDLRQNVRWTGPISGSAPELLWEVVSPSGASFSGVDVCACVGAGGAKGTVTITFHGTDDGKVYSGTLTVSGGTGGLTGFQGHGTFRGSDKTGRGTYKGVFQGGNG